MKRTFATILIGSLLLSGSALRAADAVTLAAQQEAEERYKRLSATFDELQSKYEAQQRQVSALASEVSKLREELARNNNNAATQESIRDLNRQMVKLDEVHVADNRRIQDALEKLGKAITDRPVAPPARPRPSSSDSPASSGGSTASGPARTTPAPAAGGNAIEEGFEYVIKPNDTLSKIVSDYRKEKILVTAQLVKEANPAVDWNRLQVGKKIFIPKPK